MAEDLGAIPKPPAGTANNKNHGYDDDDAGKTLRQEEPPLWHQATLTETTIAMLTT